MEGADPDLAEHILELAEALEEITRGENQRLLISQPPRHGKSSTVVYWVAWMLGRHPWLKVAYCSYGVDLAKKMSLLCRRVVQCAAFRRVFPGIALAADASGVEYWEIAGHRGAFKIVSVGSSFTGFGCNVQILDDPHKGFSDAKSESERNAVWEWFTGDARTRLEPWGDFKPVRVLLHTRFHPDDVIGRVIEGEGRPGADVYKKLVRPAIDADGKPLWKSLDFYLAERANTDPFQWAALWQCDPMASTGDFFSQDWFAIVPSAPEFEGYVRYYDLAQSKKKKSDFTASARVAVEEDGTIWILDVWRAKHSFPENKERIVRAAEAEPSTTIGLPEDMIGTALHQELEPRMIGRAFRRYNERRAGSKEQRAAVWQGRAAAGKLRLVQAPWNEEFLKECLAFPNGKHDDMVDAVSGAVAIAAQMRGGLYTPPKLVQENSEEFWRIIGDRLAAAREELDDW